VDLGLRGHVAAITGASRGLGFAIAGALAMEGCHLAICARTRQPLEQAAGVLARHGTQVLACPADVTVTAQLEAFIAATAERFGRLDILVLNAGGARGEGALETDDATFTESFGLNVLVGLRAARAAVPWMRRTGYGRLIFITSIYGREAGGRASYNIGKAAEISLAKSLARELAPEGILVNAVAPGSLMFPGSSWEGRQRADPEAIAAFVRSDLPLGRFGTPEEVANVVAFLASPRASLVSGACWTIDGCQSRSLI